MKPPPTRNPKVELGVLPALVTQHTCFAVLGIHRRRFLDLVRRLNIRHYKHGRLVIVRVADFVDAVDARASAVSPDLPEPPDEDFPRTVEEGLASIGLCLIR